MIDNYALVYYNIGVARNNLGFFKKAIKDYDKAIELSKNYKDAYYNRGVAKNNANLHKEAIEDYSKVNWNKISFIGNCIMNNSIEELLNKAKESFENKDYDKAIEYIDKVIFYNGDSYDLYHNRGLAKLNLRLYEEAIKDFNRAIELGDYNSYYERGLAKFYMAFYKEAIEDFNKVIELDKNDTASLAYNTIGLCKYNLNEFDEALKYYENAIEINPNLIIAYHNIALLKHSIGLDDEALSYLNKALEIDPDNIETYFL